MNGIPDCYNIDRTHTSRINETLKNGLHNGGVGVPLLLKNPLFDFKFFSIKIFEKLKDH